jgi:tight adherence protein C
MPGKTLFGMTAADVATLLAAVATLAVLFAMYMATTVRDPMAKRVKALNERREQLKAGITASTTKRRAKLVHQRESTDMMRVLLKKLQVLQDDQLQVAQKKLAQAGIRSKDLAVAVIFGRMVLPIAIGGLAAFMLYVVRAYPEWSDFKRFMAFATCLLGSYKAPDIYLSEPDFQAHRRDPQGPARCARSAGDLRRGGSDRGRRLRPRGQGAGPRLSGAGRRIRSSPRSSCRFLTERRQAFENLAYRVNLEAVKGVVTTMIQTEKYGTPLASALRVLSAEFRNERMMRAEEKAARLPAIMTVPLILFILPTVRGHPWPGGLFDQQEPVNNGCAQATPAFIAGAGDTRMFDERIEATGPLIKWSGDKASWFFVVLGGDVVGEIHYAAMGRTGGFGSVKVRATIGDTTWETSLFPYKEVAGFALPVKAAVRKAEGLAVGDEVALTLRI